MQKDASALLHNRSIAKINLVMFLMIRRIFLSPRRYGEIQSSFQRARIIYGIEDVRSSPKRPYPAFQRAVYCTEVSLFPLPVIACSAVLFLRCPWQMFFAHSELRSWRICSAAFLSAEAVTYSESRYRLFKVQRRRAKHVPSLNADFDSVLAPVFFFVKKFFDSFFRSQQRF